MLRGDDQVSIDAPSGSDSWIKLNHNQVGYYRVNYPENVWQQFSELLSKDINAFSIGDRTGLLNDAFALADASQLRYDLALELTRFLAQETEYVPWATVSSKMKSIRTLIYDYPAYDDILVSIVKHSPLDQNIFKLMYHSYFLALCSSTDPTSLRLRWLDCSGRRSHEEVSCSMFLSRSICNIFCFTVASERPS